MRVKRIKLVNDTSMKEAVLAVKTNKMGVRKAPRTFDVPKDSLRRRLQKLEKSNTGDNTDIWLCESTSL